jgi:hypothetical protein
MGQAVASPSPSVSRLELKCFASRCRAKRSDGETKMMKGGLLWLIGIPLPIILILFFLGYLN